MLFKCEFGMHLTVWPSRELTFLERDFGDISMSCKCEIHLTEQIADLTLVVIGNFRALPGVASASVFPCCSSVQKPLCPKMWPSALLEVQTQRNLVCLIQKNLLNCKSNQ